MINLQELILRGRFLMADAPERIKIFDCVNGKRNTAEIAKITKRHINSVRRDLNKLANVGLIQERSNKNEPIRRNGFPIYEKVPLARTIPVRYFLTPTRLSGSKSAPSLKYGQNQSASIRQPKSLMIPSEQEILDIAKNGEDQIYEFKCQGTESRKITREIAAMLNTRQGGIIFYGIDDDGNIEGTDKSLQKLDQPLQNSIRNSISPAATVCLRAVQVLGSKIIVIIVPPWNKKSVYQFDEKILLRKGTNVFGVKPEEVARLHKGIYVV